MLAFRDAWRETAGISLSPEQEQDVVHFAYLSRVLYNSRIGQSIPLYINWLAPPCDSSGESVVRLGKEFRFHIPARCSIYPEIWGSPYVGMLVTGEGTRGLFEGAVNPAADGLRPETAAVLLSPAQRFFCEDISINDGVTRFELVALDD
jgi:hypothetical protein